MDRTTIYMTWVAMHVPLGAGMGRAGRVHGTRELVLHKNYLAIYRAKGGDVEILRIHHVAKQL